MKKGRSPPKIDGNSSESQCESLENLLELFEETFAKLAADFGHVIMLVLWRSLNI